MLRWWRRRTRASEQRWLVIDVETTGMDLVNDQLLSVGGVALRNDRVIPGDSFEITIKRQQVSTRDNILVHGIGAQAQLTGVDPGEALHAFVDFVAEAPLIAFHAHFDRTFLVRAIKGYVDRPLDNPWLDLAALAPAIDPAARLKSLDEWLQRYQIPVAARHSAAADAFATALLAARLLTLARRQGASDFVSLQRLAGAARWLQ